jgi:hypothetical protein
MPWKLNILDKSPARLLDPTGDVAAQVYLTDKDRKRTPKSMARAQRLLDTLNAAERTDASPAGTSTSTDAQIGAEIHTRTFMASILRFWKTCDAQETELKPVYVLLADVVDGGKQPAGYYLGHATNVKSAAHRQRELQAEGTPCVMVLMRREQ